jgi:hypothetical protein
MSRLKQLKVPSTMETFEVTVQGRWSVCGKDWIAEVSTKKTVWPKQELRDPISMLSLVYKYGLPITTHLINQNKTASSSSLDLLQYLS